MQKGGGKKKKQKEKVMKKIRHNLTLISIRAIMLSFSRGGSESLAQIYIYIYTSLRLNPKFTVVSSIVRVCRVTIN